MRAHILRLFRPIFGQHELQQSVQDQYSPERQRDDDPIPAAADQLPEHGQAVPASGSLWQLSLNRHDVQGM